jgi:hypothetical protein
VIRHNIRTATDTLAIAGRALHQNDILDVKTLTFLFAIFSILMTSISLCHLKLAGSTVFSFVFNDKRCAFFRIFHSIRIPDLAGNLPYLLISDNLVPLGASKTTPSLTKFALIVCILLPRSFHCAYAVMLLKFEFSHIPFL